MVVDDRRGVFYNCGGCGCDIVEVGVFVPIPAESMSPRAGFYGPRPPDCWIRKRGRILDGDHWLRNADPDWTRITSQ